MLVYSKIKILQNLVDKFTCPFCGPLKLERSLKIGHLDMDPVITLNEQLPALGCIPVLGLTVHVVDESISFGYFYVINFTV